MLRSFFKSLFAQVVIALILGVSIGIFIPGFAIELKPLGDSFIKLIKMFIAPLVFGVIVHGIVGTGDLKKVGRVGIKSVIYFEIITTIALLLGLVIAYIFNLGDGINIDGMQEEETILGYKEHLGKMMGIVDFLMHIIPSTVIGAFASGDILQILLSAVLFGVGLSFVGKRATPIVEFIALVTDVLFQIIGFIILLAPLGVLGAISFTVGKYGIGSLQQLGYLVIVFYLSVFLFVVVILGCVMRLIGFNLLKLLRYLREELMIVLGTASNDCVLPQIMQKLRKLGIKDSTVGLVISTGYSFNLDAFSIYLTLTAIFIAKATNTALSIGDLLTVLGVALLTSKGAHGIPGSAIVVLAATLSVLPVIPAIGLVLVLSVDWFMGIARALGNLVGNCVATIVIAVWEGDIDRKKANFVLNGEQKKNDGKKDID